MSAENRVNCVLGNGGCPQTCLIFESSKAISEELDDDFDPSQSRLKVIFADALDHSINVTHVAAVLASCINEGKPKVQDQAPEAPASPTPPFTNIPL